MLRPSFMYHPSQELDALARDWAKPPPDALFSLRVPIDYVHIQTAVRVAHIILRPDPFSHMFVAPCLRRLCLCMPLPSVSMSRLTEP